MKKTNLLLVFAAVALIFTSCDKHKCDDKEFDPDNIEGFFCYPALDARPDVSIDYKEVVEMLTEYDTTRIEPLAKALGYPDSRINTYNFDQFVQYLNYVKKLSKKVKPEIKISGISFISAAKSDYNGTGKSYQDLIYIPTTTINGKQIAFDAVLSAQRDSLVTFKAALKENGYNWIYNTKEDFEAGKKEGNNYQIKNQVKNEAGFVPSLQSNELSGAGNRGTLSPPY